MALERLLYLKMCGTIVNIDKCVLKYRPIDAKMKMGM